MFFFNVTASTEIYTLSLHDALPISAVARLVHRRDRGGRRRCADQAVAEDRKSTRLNSSHVKISYAVFCLKKKNRQRNVKPSTIAILLMPRIKYECRATPQRQETRAR